MLKKVLYFDYIYIKHLKVFLYMIYIKIGKRKKLLYSKNVLKNTAKFLLAYFDIRIKKDINVNFTVRNLKKSTLP
jgi:hypothetical protein